MEEKCKQIIELERKIKKIVIIFSIVICLIVINLKWNKISYFFTWLMAKVTDENMFKFLTATSGVLTLLGVIITIGYTEYSRKKQNKLDFYKERNIRKLDEFREEVKKQVELTSLEKLIEIRINTRFRTTDDLYSFLLKLDNFLVGMKLVRGKIFWYYDSSNINKYPKLMEFNVILDNEINKLTVIRKKYLDVITSHTEINITKKLLKEIYKVDVELTEFCNTYSDNFKEVSKAIVEEKEKNIFSEVFPNKKRYFK